MSIRPPFSTLFTFCVLFLNRPLSGVFHVYIIYSHPLTLYINLTIYTYNICMDHHHPSVRAMYKVYEKVRDFNPSQI